MDDSQIQIKLMELDNTIFLAKLNTLLAIQASNGVDPFLNSIKRGGKIILQWIDRNTGRWLSEDQIPSPDEVYESDGITVRSWVGDDADKVAEYYKNKYGNKNDNYLPFLKTLSDGIEEQLDHFGQALSRFAGNRNPVNKAIDNAFSMLERAGKDAYIGQERQTFLAALDGFKGLVKDIEATKKAFQQNLSKVDKVAVEVFGAGCYAAIAATMAAAGTAMFLVESLTGEKIPERDRLPVQAAMFAIAGLSPFDEIDDNPKFMVATKKIAQVCKQGLENEIQKALYTADIDKLNKLIKSQAISARDVRRFTKQQASLLLKNNKTIEREAEAQSNKILTVLKQNPEIDPSHYKELGKASLNFLKMVGTVSSLSKTYAEIELTEAGKDSDPKTFRLIQLNIRKTLQELEFVGRNRKNPARVLRQMKLSEKSMESYSQKLTTLKSDKLNEIADRQKALEEYSQQDMNEIYEAIQKYGWTIPFAGFLVWFAANTHTNVTPYMQKAIQALPGA